MSDMKEKELVTTPMNMIGHNNETPKIYLHQAVFDWRIWERI